MTKRVICEALICGDWHKIAVESLYPYKKVKRRCPECESQIKLMKQGHNGQKAHFEHQKRNPNCSESIAFKGKSSFDSNHVQPTVVITKADLQSSFSFEFLLEYVDDSIESILCEDSLSAINKSEYLNVQLKNVPKGQLNPKRVEGTTNQYYRDARVVAYVLRLANGFCQLCKNEAPFKTAKGRPYLEVHHIHRLADGGSDTVGNTVALCPNCHKEMHFGENSQSISKQLLFDDLHITKTSS
ncbi:HNH endonuclease [Photobacterium minamisatsumaniensis]|uniref:HNH endonuclease n=1 Tax=Photobacterium minamisatsumaniensis TaxID=2910233 RepID=UPI003D115123